MLNDFEIDLAYFGGHVRCWCSVLVLWVSKGDPKLARKHVYIWFRRKKLKLGEWVARTDSMDRMDG